MAQKIKLSTIAETLGISTATVSLALRDSPLAGVGVLEPKDIADAVAFLCSEKSSWLTGEVLDLNGGAHLKRYPNIHAHLTKLMGQ